MGDKKMIVVVDDDEDLLRLVGTSFRAQGYDVTELKDGKSAKEYLLDEEKAKGISLLVLDRILPDMDGVDLLKDLKNPPYPVLILSSLSSEKDIMEGLTKGAVDYISKPFNMSILLQKAKTLIK